LAAVGLEIAGSVEEGYEHCGPCEAEADIGRGIVGKQAEGEREGTNLKHVENGETPERTPRPWTPEQRGVEQAATQAAKYRERDESVGPSPERGDTQKPERRTYKGGGNAGENSKRSAQGLVCSCHSRYSGRSAIRVERAGSAARRITDMALSCVAQAADGR